ncbi:MAG: hypothetical protein HYY50_04345 [Candidatus Kerfeldbacteria bacterium]|nr:hypothetical protein [Candidatus Kerfeldbacteria bacterium]
MDRRASVVLTPIIVSLLAVAAFLVVLNLSIPTAKNSSPTNRNAGITSSYVPVPGYENVNEMIVVNTIERNENANVTNTVINPTAGWTDYGNSDLGFDLKLPPGWSVDQSRSAAEEIVFWDGVATETREAIKSIGTVQTITQWATVYEGEAGYRVTDFTLDGVAGKRVRFSGLGTDYIGIKTNGRLYVVTVGRMEENGMLDTFHLRP